MTAADLDAVLGIEQQTLRAPHARKLLTEELDREWARLEVVRPGLGAAVAGYINYWIVRDEIHLLGIATDPAQQRRGFARALVEHMLAVANDGGCHYVTLEVRKSNRGAIELYRAYGFEAVAVRPNYYVEDREDALVMVLDLAA